MGLADGFLQNKGTARHSRTEILRDESSMTMRNCQEKEAFYVLHLLRNNNGRAGRHLPEL